jgi:predicted TIM-barrel fold metal-dependent hydrolase
MKRTSLVLACALLLLALSAAPVFAPRASAQGEVDRALAEEIYKIRAIDNHAHPLRATREGEEDREFDALIPDTLEPSPLPVRLRPDNPEFAAAWSDLWGFRHDMGSTEVRASEVPGARLRVMRDRGDGYPAWVLDKLNIEVMFANRVAMGRGLVPERFRWVAFDDALILPLSSSAVRKINPDYAAFYPGEDALLRRYLSDLNMKAVPATLREFTARVVTPTLERQKRGGAVAVKFEAAYLRALDFADASEQEAARVYARYARGPDSKVAPTAAEYKPLQDFLFRYVAREAGRLGLAVHIHTGAGVGSYYGVSGGDPLLLEPALNDPVLRKTNFVLIHGGWPYARHAAALLDKPNVYLDFSAQTFFLYPRELAENLRVWLERQPEKILFGTDAFLFSPEVGWEEVGWLSNRTGRDALALALTAMMRDGEITRPRASELARMVMRENAARLYGIK